MKQCEKEGAFVEELKWFWIIIIVANFLAIELGNMILIQGMQWLLMMGFMGVHWPSMRMTFRAGGSQVILKADPPLMKVECSLKTLTKT